MRKMIGRSFIESSEEDFSGDSDSDIGVDYEFKIPTNTWIIKPGENTNRGNGIIVCKTLNQVKKIVLSGAVDKG